jgi:hypothetical protein
MTKKIGFAGDPSRIHSYPNKEDPPKKDSHAKLFKLSLISNRANTKFVETNYGQTTN